ncbi:MAG: aspartate kinase [Oligoflexia bacterium]|nr:aspartate kinase [Oligoflexia bacterium]
MIVKKYGGSSVASPQKMLAIADLLKNEVQKGNQLIIIVSAMGDFTDDLVKLSREITDNPNQREYDMLLSSGERISMALMAMALHSKGIEAISFTGSQSGVMTDGSHSSARIVEIRPVRVHEEVKKKKTVIIAGFQGVNPDTKEVTTLGRGGSDTTAVAVAAKFHAKRCDILTDVKGIYSCDPRLPGTEPHHFKHLDYESTLEMAYWGARVLHYRSVELAERTRIPIRVSLSSDESSGTLIGDMENVEVRAVNYNLQILAVTYPEVASLTDALEQLGEALEKAKLATPQIIFEKPTSEGRTFYLTGPEELFESIGQGLVKHAVSTKKSKPSIDSQWATVTLTGRGLVNSSLVFEAPKALRAKNIVPEDMIITPLSITFLVQKGLAGQASQVLHEKFVK